MAKKSKAKTSKVEPTYLKFGTSFTMGLHDVIRAVKVIQKHKHLDKFAEAAKREKAFVTVGADTVNFVKDFMVKNKIHNDPIGKHIVNARVDTGVTTMVTANFEEVTAARDPFRPCKFTSRG